MKIVRVKAVAVEHDTLLANKTIVLTYHTDESDKVIESQWMGVWTEDGVRYPFIWEPGQAAIFDFGWTDSFKSPTTFGTQRLKVGKQFIVSSAPTDEASWEATWQITNVTSVA